MKNEGALSEGVAREQDVKITELIDDLVAAASGNTADDVQCIVDELHEYIADLRGDSAALLDALARVTAAAAVTAGVAASTAERRRIASAAVVAINDARALLRKHGRLS